VQNQSLQEKIKDLEFAFTQVETISAKRVSDVVTALEKEFTQLKSEKSGLEMKLKTLQPTDQVEGQWKKLSQDYQSIEEMRNNKIITLENELKTLQETNSQLLKNTEKARKRERYLESVIMHYSLPLPESARPKPTKPSETSEEAEKLRVDQITQQLVKQAQERTTDLEKELTQVKANVDDLINEIEGMSNSEASTRAQSEGLLKQIHESQTIQQAVFEENLKLLTDIEEFKTRKTDSETR
jgi:chromosome segregation ATPase